MWKRKSRRYGNVDKRKDGNKDMMIHEFAKLTGIEPAPECWERIEYVYMNCDEFKTKQDIAEFYKKHDMNGIEKKYQELMESMRFKDEMKEFLADLAFFANGYVAEIKNHLAQIAKEIFRDKTIRRMLREYRVRCEKEQQDLTNDFMSAVFHGIEVRDGNPLTNASSFRNVIAALLIDEWWHEQCKKENNK